MFLLLLVAVLIILVLGLVYFSHRQLNQLRVAVTKNSNNLTQLTSILDTLNNAHEMPSFVMGGGSLPRESTGSDMEQENVSQTMPVPKPAEYLETVYEEGHDNEARIEEVDDSDDSDDSDNDSDTNSDLSDDESNMELDPTVDLNVDALIDNVDEFPVNETTEKIINVATNNNGSTSSSKGRKKRIPEGSARDFDLGYQKVSENDNKVYEVVEGAGGRHRWKMVSNDVIVKVDNKETVEVSEDIVEDVEEVSKDDVEVNTDDAENGVEVNAENAENDENIEAVEVSADNVDEVNVEAVEVNAENVEDVEEVEVNAEEVEVNAEEVEDGEDVEDTEDDDSEVDDDVLADSRSEYSFE
jgi:hypothetical protein